MILNLVLEAMENSNVNGIIKDWIQDNVPDSHPEKTHYLKVFTTHSMIPIPMKDYLSIVDKFGNKQERKRCQRARRTLLRDIAKLENKKGFINTQKRKKMCLKIIRRHGTVPENKRWYPIPHIPSGTKGENLYETLIEKLSA